MYPRAIYRFVLLCCLATCSTLLGEQLHRQPGDLVAGDRYRLAFVTSEMTSATSAEISSYNDFVQVTADAAPTVGEWGIQWSAIASTANVDARDNTNTNPEIDADVPIYLLDGSLLMPTYDGLWGGDLPLNLSAETLRFNLTELGERLIADTPGQDGRFVWTGTDQWGKAPQGLALGADRSAFVGQANDAPLAWFDGEHSQRVSLEYPLYAISGTLIAVPEPTSSLPILIGIVGLMSAMRAVRSPD